MKFGEDIQHTFRRLRCSSSSGGRMFALCVAASSALALAACGSDGGGASPLVATACSSAISNATGRWVTVVNNTVTPPGPAGVGKNFFSFNQPSINGEGKVVFRARAKAPGGGGGGEPHRGVWAVDLCSSPDLQTILDTATAVPAPNNLGAIFNETPSIPRIDISSPLIASRGNSQPAWSYPDPATQSETRAGTTGIFTWLNGPLTTGVNTLGNVADVNPDLDFTYFQVPLPAPAGTKFDVFPGSPTLSNGKYIAFKGNYTDVIGKTGVYFRDISVPRSPVIAVADTSTMIPGQAVPFGSTAPPKRGGRKDCIHRTRQ